MTLPLMPKATAVWLVENTSLTFDQIGEFCGLHALEVQAIADGEVALADARARPDRQRPAHARRDRTLPERPEHAAA